jgi:hypothetical protein
VNTGPGEGMFTDVQHDELDRRLDEMDADDTPGVKFVGPSNQPESNY